MELTSAIIGPVVTEKAEVLKSVSKYLIQVHPHATKIDVKNALRKFYDVDVESVRVMNTVPKRRMIGAGKVMEKRHRSKRMIVTLAKKSKPLDLATFKAA